MARRRRESTDASSDSEHAHWCALTWADLDAWAGARTVTRGRNYQRLGQVDRLAISKAGRLVAFVHGSERYVTSAWLEPAGRRRQLASSCTCPVGVACKHAVAVVGEFLAELAENRTPPRAPDDDSRLLLLSGDLEDDQLDEELTDDWGDEDESASNSRRPKVQTRQSTNVSNKRRTRKEWDAAIKAHLEQQGQAELAALACSLAERFPEVRRELRERIELGESDASQLIVQARELMHKTTATEGWSDHWSGEGFVPDYKPLQRRLSHLVDLGCADAVITIGRDLLELGMEQIGQSHDEGETGMAFSECFDEVLKAVPHSNLTAAEQLLFVIDCTLADDFGVLGNKCDELLDACQAPAVWAEVAATLRNRLSGGSRRKRGEAENWLANYSRDQLTSWIQEALARSGQTSEIASLLEDEARRTGSFVRLVQYLVEQKRYDDAERWAREGIEHTTTQYPGIATQLAEWLDVVARKRQRWDIVAAHAACKFLSAPTTHTFHELITAAERANCGEAVRSAALAYLETGKHPVFTLPSSAPAKRFARRSGKSSPPAFPLPCPDYAKQLLRVDGARSAAQQPHFRVLLDIAITEKAPDRVWHWYEKLDETSSERQALQPWGRYDSMADEVAAAVADAYPERALSIYQHQLDATLPDTGQMAYDRCATLLGRMRKIMQAQDRDDYWGELVADIRHRYGNRPRFMDTLDKLEGKRVVDKGKAAKRR